MRPNALRFPDKRESAKAAEQRLDALLLNATDGAFANLSVELLARTHNVDRRLIECKLNAARDRRRRRG